MADPMTQTAQYRNPSGGVELAPSRASQSPCLHMEAHNMAVTRNHVHGDTDPQGFPPFGCLTMARGDVEYGSTELRLFFDDPALIDGLVDELAKLATDLRQAQTERLTRALNKAQGVDIRG